VFGEDWKVRITTDLLEQLQRRIGPVRVAYGPPGGTDSAAQA